MNKQDEVGFYVVSNAGCAEKDLKHIRTHLEAFRSKGGECRVDVLDASLLALQGPTAVRVVEEVAACDLSGLAFMSSKRMEICGIPVYLSRCGYTGKCCLSYICLSCLLILLAHPIHV